MNCQYTLKQNGKLLIFKSVDELYEFIGKNTDLLKLGLDIVFDEGTVIQNNVKAALQSLSKASSRSRTIFDPNLEEYIVTSPTKTSITTGIYNWTSESGKRALFEFDISNWRKNKMAQIKLSEPTLSDEEINKLLDKEESTWDTKADIGTQVHKIAELVFSDNYKNDSIYTVTKLDKKIVDRLIDTFVDLKDKLNKNNRLIFLPEITLENDLYIARLDLISIAENGRIDIYDFKLSDKEYSNWDKSKITTIDYQLAGYRAMLASLGFPVNRTTLNVIPIIANINYDTKELKDFKLESIQTRTGTNKELNYPNGIITTIATQNIPPKSSVMAENSETLETIKRQVHTAFGAYEETTVKEFMHNVKFDKTTGKYYFEDRTSKKDKDGNYKKIEATEENLEEVINNYLQEKLEYNTTTIYNSFWRQFQIMKSTGKQIENSNVFKGKYTHLKITNYLQKLFAEYIDNPKIELVEGYEDLVDMGIYIFLNKETNIVDIVSLSNTDLKKKLKLNFDYDGILANLGSSAKFKNLQDMLTATVGNAKLLETMLVLNNIPSLANLKIGNVRVVNPRTGQCDYASVDQLKNNFYVLCKELKITNNFDNGNLTFADPLVAIKLSIDNILTRNKFDFENDVYKMFATTDWSQETVEHKIEMLLKLQELLKKVRPIDYNALSREAYADEYVYMYHKISQIITDLKGIHFNLDRDTVAFGISLKDLKNIMFLTGTMFENPETIKNPIMHEIVSSCSTYFQKARIDYINYKSEILDRDLKLYESRGLNKTSRYTFGDTTKVFDTMFKRNTDGSLNEDFVTVNPYDSNVNLNSTERAWLKEFLFIVNRLNDNVNPEWTYEEHINSEVVKNLIASGEYFKVPLLKSSLFTRLKNNSGSLANLSSYIRDSIKNSLEFERMIESFEKAEDMGKYQDYTEMYNYMTNKSDIVRKQRIEDYGINNFETNLELIRDVFQLSYIRQKTFNKVLPYIQNLRNSLLRYAYDANVDTQDLEDVIDRFLRTVVFNEPGPTKPEDRTNLAYLNALQSVTRAMMLGFNVSSLIREPIQGLYMIYSRAATGVLGENAFGVKDVTKAYGFVMSDVFTKVGEDNYTLGELLNVTYGMANAELAGLANELYTGKTGFKFLGKAIYWPTRATDYPNRMVVLVAQMMHDGCFKAHSVDPKTKQLVYDWTKDERFEQFAKGNKSHPLYNKQKADYYARLLSFNEEGYNLEFDEDKPVALPRAYTKEESKNIKVIADTMFGFMNKESAMKLRGHFLGKLMSQFLMYFSSTKKRWINAGNDNGYEGYWDNEYDLDGNQLFYHSRYNEKTKKNELYKSAEKSDMAVRIWKGKYTEGMVNSAAWLFKYLLRNRFSLKYNENYVGAEHIDYRLHNVGQGIMDIAWHYLCVLFYYILFKAFFGDEPEKAKGTFGKLVLDQTLINSAAELVPSAAIAPILNMESPTLEGLSRLYDSMTNMLKGTETVGEAMLNNIAVARTFSYIIPDSEE